MHREEEKRVSGCLHHPDTQGDALLFMLAQRRRQIPNVLVFGPPTRPFSRESRSVVAPKKKAESVQRTTALCYVRLSMTRDETDLNSPERQRYNIQAEVPLSAADGRLNGMKMPKGINPAQKR